MSRFPDTAAGWAALIGLVIAVFGIEHLAVRWGWLKPEKELNPGWAFARSRMITVAVCAGVLLIYFFVFDRT